MTTRPNRTCLVGVWYANNSHVTWYTDRYWSLTLGGSGR